MQDTTPTTEAGFDLDPAEIRVLGVLIEKSFITPDAYPLSINAITTGCNQLTAREPVMSLSEAEVQDAVDRLIVRRLVSKRDQQSARVAKYEHLVRLRHSLPPAEQAVLAILLLRGAQTAGELRINSERWYRFADISSVDAFLEELQDRSTDKGGALVVKLPRAPGAREQRWAHLLCGPVDAGTLAAPPDAAGPWADDTRPLAARVNALESEVAQLRSALQNVLDQLGMSQPGQSE